ncbi:MAG: type II secretion system protein [Patescibacteria group bacterium]
MLNNIKTIQKDRGFTIVELLIVIVVIGILAAITIVAYNGISNRAKTTSAQTTAANVAKKLEAYNAEVGNYPATFGLLTAAGAAGTTYQMSASDATFIATTDIAAGNATEKTINYADCTGAGGVGKRVSYWKFDAPTGIQRVYVGGATATSTCTNTAA